MIQTLNLLEQYFQRYEETERSTVGINQRAKESKLMDKTCPDFSQSSGNGIICDECHLKEEKIQNLLRQNKFLNIVADSKITDDMISTFDKIDESSASKIVLLKENEDLYNYLKIYETCLMIKSLHALKLAEQIKKKLGDLFIPPDEATMNEYGLVYSKFQLKQKLNLLFRRLKHNQDFFDKFCKNPSHKLMVLKNIMVCVYNYTEEEVSAMEGYATTQERKDDMRRTELHSSETQRKPLLDLLLESE